MATENHPFFKKILVFAAIGLNTIKSDNFHRNFQRKNHFHLLSSYHEQANVLSVLQVIYLHAFNTSNNCIVYTKLLFLQKITLKPREMF